MLDRCVEASANEEGSYFYNFTVNGNVVRSPRTGRRARETECAHGGDELRLVHARVRPSLVSETVTSV